MFMYSLCHFEVFCVCLQGYLALEGLHACDLVHRDVKPGNILLSDTGHVLGDLGSSSKSRKDSASKIHAFAEVPKEQPCPFTQPYAPPEAFGLGGHYGPCGDVYALGILLVEIGLAVMNEPAPEPGSAREDWALAANKLETEFPLVHHVIEQAICESERGRRHVLFWTALPSF